MVIPLTRGNSKGWKVKMCEGGPPSLSLVGSLSFLLRPADAGLRRTRWRVIRMCEGSFERRSASAGVLGKTAPAVAGHAYAWILDWETQVGE